MIKENFELFFDYNDFGYTFYNFSLQHLFATILFAIIPFVLVYVFREKLKRWKFEKTFAILIGLFGLALEFTQYYWHYHGGQTDWRHIYPTTLCGLTIYLSSIAMISRNKYISSVVYFFSYGAFFTFVFPQVDFGFNRFRFYAFFVIHGLIFFNTAYLLFVRGVKADRKAMINSFILLFPVLILSLIFNIIFSDSQTAMNYFYLNYPPFEFPVYSWVYNISTYLYTGAVFITYYLLMLIMLGISAIFKLNKNSRNSYIKT